MMQIDFMSETYLVKHTKTEIHLYQKLAVPLRITFGIKQGLVILRKQVALLGKKLNLINIIKEI